MKKLLPYLLFIVLTNSALAQIESGLLFGLTNGTTAEINAVTNMEKGAMVYNTDINEVYVYNGSVWVSSSQPSVHMGLVVITATGNLTVSGLPFKPSQISFTAHANIESLNLNSDNGIRNNDNGIANSFGSMNGFARNDGASIVQQVIYVGGNGNSINDISRYASSNSCIGIRYSNQNGDNLGITAANVSSFNANGFSLNVTSRADNLVVLYQAYK
jgi:hypothetical protein